MVLFAASEVYPYAKTGGLADVAFALPKALESEVSVKTVMPLYNSVDRQKHGIVDSGKSFCKTLDGITHRFDIFYAKNDPKMLFLFNPILCDRFGLYYDEHGDFGDNDLRFGLFSYGVLELIKAMDLHVEAIHINDWQTALIAPLAKQVYKLDAKIVLTIHNLAYQGIFHKSIMDKLELSWETFFKPRSLEQFDGVNYLKGAIYYADSITTVSPNYAKEIQTPSHGFGLDVMLQTHAHKIVGILNGIDTDDFNPQTDTALFKNYSQNEYGLKNKNKKALCKELKLSGYKKPLFVFIGRFTWQKGVDTLLENIPVMAGLDANFIFLGSGEKHYEAAFSALKNRYPNISIHLGYDEVLSRKMYAASDFLLMPSKFEPCGLNQMIAMRYGSLPVVSDTGGLHDSVIDINDASASETGRGIVLQSDNGYDFLLALAKALALFSNKKRYKHFAKTNMAQDFSWKNSAKRYLQLYL